MCGSKTEITASVTGPNGFSLTKNCNDGFEFTAADYGIYEILFSASDSLGNKADEVPVSKIYVVDTAPPSLTVNWTVNESYKLKSYRLRSCKPDKKKEVTVTLPGAAVQDNVTPAAKLVFAIFVIDPDKYYTQVTDSLSGAPYAFTKTGRHQVVYYVRDEAGNVTTKTFYITITG